MPSKQVTFYSTYGYRKDSASAWQIPIRVWVHMTHDHLQLGLNAVIEHLDHHNPQVLINFSERIADLIADDLPSETVSSTFDTGSGNQPYGVALSAGEQRTDKNGLTHGVISLDADDATRLQGQQGSVGWLKCRACALWFLTT